ncbi:aminotransferase class V-fold PLP-dependent enzyme [Meiothermus granaticius]|uniref:cysteine desulfurase n=1 Tax=Meiothermus granaticius NBRC 107808 TaxID=1227551 RepID=A0A399FBW1_9DEIN|nr:cysteine desulfurase [Meiothermus granaticius]RIH93166.1 putative cysteine desulfurase [Meiothermus granaticius NBRC 107808]GEM87720.1 cysteine desulfurase [Meiothermus granaticius NBRC 107808]
MPTAREVRQDFPLIGARPDQVYLDSTASAQKPRVVIEALSRFYREHYANVHRGGYALSLEATQAYEDARKTLARFIGAAEREVIFVRNATEALNLVAYAWAMKNLRSGDEILLTEMEHHANLVPWHFVARQTGARIQAIPITAEGRLDLAALETLLTERTRLVSLTHMSNVLGTLNPVAEIAKAAKETGALLVVDGAQSAPHLPVNVQRLGADFFAFSGHKMGGPTGVGVLWGRYEILAQMEPFLGGGEMIREVYLDRSTYAQPPQRFEAGTPAIAEAVGLGAAAEYLLGVGLENLWKHEQALLEYALHRLDEELPEVRTFGPRGPDRGGVIAFTLGRVHAHDVASALDQQGIAVRAGHHCAQPLHRKLGVPATTRASFYLYTTREDVDRFIEAMRAVREFFKDWL